MFVTNIQYLVTLRNTLHQNNVNHKKALHKHIQNTCIEVYARKIILPKMHMPGKSSPIAVRETSAAEAAHCGTAYIQAFEPRHLAAGL